MALIVSAASGNFNVGATWVGGVVPGGSDEARAATGHTVTITANTTCDEISATSTGKFVINDGVTLTSKVTNKATSASIVLEFLSASPAVCSIVGDCSGGGNTGRAVRNVSTGTINITGNCTAGGTNNNPWAVLNSSTGTINITGNCIGGTATVGANAVVNESAGTVNITGNCTASLSGGIGAVNNSTGTLSVIGTLQSSQTAAAVAGTSVQQNTILSGPFLTETTRGVAPVYCAAWRWNASPSNSTYMEVMTTNLLAKRNLVTADNITGMPAASNVKSGIAYGPSSELTGTFSQTVTPSTADIATAVWGAATRTLTTSSGPTAVEIRQEIDANSTKLDASVSSRLASASYTAPTTPPTAAEIATAVEGSLLNEADGQAVLNAIVGAIGNQNVSEVSLVAAIRSDIERTGGKLDSVPTAAANASAVWSTATKQITGGTVDTLTNSPSVPSAASIAAATRTELAVELARVDSAVSSRMAASEATKLDAVKVKTDALPIERLQNCATTAIVGNLIAQANS